MSERFSPALREVSDAVLAVASNLEIEQVLQRLVDVSRGLVHARYAALGIPNGEGGFAQFLTVGHERGADRAARPAARDARPARRDARGARLVPHRATSRPTRASAAGGRAAIPDMRSFLGVPICAAGEVIGAFYLTDKEERRRVLGRPTRS